MDSQTPQAKGRITIIKKQLWQKYTPGRIPYLMPPASGVIFGYPQLFYGTSVKVRLGNRPNSEACLKEIQFMQEMDMKKYPDIKYNFMIGPNGKVYEGRGWTTVSSLPSKLKYLNSKAYYFCFIGDFFDNPPVKEHYELREELIRYGIEHNYITPKYFVYTMRHGIVTDWEPFDFYENRVLR